MKLITELYEDTEYLTEGTKGEDPLKHYIRGIFIQADIKNRNGRLYPLATLSKEVARYVKESVDTCRAYGELGHPQGPQINLDRVSHLITELHQDGKNFIGKALLMDTPYGNTAKGILNSGGKLGVSTRGMGSLEPGKGGEMIVQPDYKIATAGDIVADPSAPKAFVEGIMENVEWIYDAVKDTWISENLHDIKKNIQKMSLREIEEKKTAIFEDYMALLASKTI